LSFLTFMFLAGTAVSKTSVLQITSQGVVTMIRFKANYYGRGRKFFPTPRRHTKLSYYFNINILTDSNKKLFNSQHVSIVIKMITYQNSYKIFIEILSLISYLKFFIKSR
jgi:hypothetical protein